MYFAAPTLNELLLIYLDAHSKYRKDIVLNTTTIEFNTTSFNYYGIYENRVVEISDISFLKLFIGKPIFVKRDEKIYIYDITHVQRIDDKVICRIYLNPKKDVFNKYISKYNLGLFLGHILAGINNA